MAAAPHPTTTDDAIAVVEPDVVGSLLPIINRLGGALMPTTEIVLHDLRQLPTSIVAIAGDVTGRAIGDPPTDVLLEHLASGSHDDMLGYRTSLPGGKQLQSSTIILRDADGEPVGALCINNDMTHWLLLRDLADAALAAQHPLDGVTSLVQTADAAMQQARHPTGERFARTVEELADHMINRAIAEVEVPVALMKKEHKLRVVANLQDHGMFLIKDSVETVAGHLEVSRFTIYNYLNEVAAERSDGLGEDAPTPANR